MNVAIPIWLDRVSPVLDSSTQARVFHVDGGKLLAKTALSIRPDDRVGTFLEAEIDVLICGAASRQLLDRLVAEGVEVVHDVCGDSDEVLIAYLEGRLDEPRFCMPGSPPPESCEKQTGALGESREEEV